MRRALIISLIILLILLAGLAAAASRLLHIDESAVFMPMPHPARAETQLTIRGEGDLPGLTHDRLALGGHSIAISRLPHRGGDAAPLIISCFGNASDRRLNGVDYLRKLAPHGEAMVWDYPGYGDSSGEARVAAVEAVIDDLVPRLDQEAADRPLIFWGHSLGGFICSQMAARSQEMDALILETTAPSVEAVAKAWTPGYLPLDVTFEDALLRFDIPSALSDVDAPILIIGGARDRILPVELSRELAAALPQAQYLELPNGTHYSAGFDPNAQAAVATLLEGITLDP